MRHHQDDDEPVPVQVPPSAYYKPPPAPVPDPVFSEDMADLAWVCCDATYHPPRPKKADADVKLSSSGSRTTSLRRSKRSEKWQRPGTYLSTQAPLSDAGDAGVAGVSDLAEMLAMLQGAQAKGRFQNARAARAARSI